MNILLILVLVLAAACAAEEPGRMDHPPTVDSTGALAGPAANGSPQAAAAVLRDYYAAIGARDYARAYRRWASAGEASGQSFDAFRQGFAETATLEAEVGTPGRIDPAAGSRYVRIPITVQATTTSGELQCFRGTYTLRRAVVPGATAEQRHWRIASAEVETRPPAECEPAGERDDATAQVATVVEAFGRRLASVSLLAPQDTLLREIQVRYGPYLTAALLEAWLQRPSEAPGREVSSPWPDRIEVRGTERVAADHYRVTGEVVYVTSVEVGRGGAVERRPVSVDVVRDGGWRIASYEGG